MDVEEAVTRMRELLRFNNRISEDTIIRTLADGQAQRERNEWLPWFLVVNEHPLVTVADTATIALPDDFLQEVEEKALWRLNTDGRPRTEILKSPWDQVISYDEDGEITAAPQYYRLEVTQLRVYPTPDAAYNLRYNYYKKDEEIEIGGNENLWLKHAADVILGSAGERLAMAASDDRALQLFSAMRSRGETDLYNQTIARGYGNTRLQMGGPH